MFCPGEIDTWLTKYLSNSVLIQIVLRTIELKHPVRISAFLAKVSVRFQNLLQAGFEVIESPS